MSGAPAGWPAIEGLVDGRLPNGSRTVVGWTDEAISVSVLRTPLPMASYLA